MTRIPFHLARALPLALLVALLGCGDGAREGVVAPQVSAGLAEAEAPPAPAPPPRTVVLISLDGTRPGDVSADVLPSLYALAERGARAEALVSVLPSNTFPSHVSMATGVTPEHHGIVNNDFVDPERGDFDRGAIPSFIEVAPVWSILDRHGIPSASYYWVGSEGPWRDGTGPTHWHPFSDETPEQDKADAILAWLDERDPERRPRFIASWFRGADRAGHRHGPESEAVREALQEQEPAIASLLAGIEERGLWASTTVIFVSDHGMLPRGRGVDLRGALADAGIEARLMGAGGFASVYLEDPEADAERVVELARSLGVDAHERERAPASWRVANPRFGDVVVVAPPDATLESDGLLGRVFTEGFHGYPPETPGMEALFLAAGPGIDPGTRLGRVRALDVAPTVLAILGVEPPEWMEGRPIEALVATAPQPGDAVVGGEAGG